MDDFLKERFSSYLRSESLAPKTIKRYLAIVRGFAIWYADTNDREFSPDGVTSLDLLDYRTYLNQVKRVKPNTLNTVINGLRAFWKFAIDEKLATVDPTRKLKTKRTSMSKQAPKWLERREQQKYLHYIDDLIDLKKSRGKSVLREIRNLAIIHCMLSAGLRVEEVSLLELIDIDLKKKTLTIREGKGDKFAILPINTTVVKALEIWLEERPLIAAPENPFLFPSQLSKSGHIGVRMIETIVCNYASGAQVEELTCHVLRHTFCKNLERAGHSLEMIRTYARHEDLNTTMRYTLPDQRELRKMVESVEQ